MASFSRPPNNNNNNNNNNKRPPPEPFFPSSSSTTPSSANKKPRFDTRNPSTLNPTAGAGAAGDDDLDATDELILDADVIGNHHRRRRHRGGNGVEGLNLGVGGEGVGPVKRNAVRIDGYDSDSEEENFDRRAAERARLKARSNNTNAAAGEGDGDFIVGGGGGGGGASGRERPGEVVGGSKDEEDDDMFADLEESTAMPGGGGTADGDDDEEIAAQGKKRSKDVRFLDPKEIEGQVMGSKSGGHVSGDLLLGSDGRQGPSRRKGRLSKENDTESDSSGDEEDRALPPDEEEMEPELALEVGAGGKKRHAPRLDAFNLRDEEEEGRFDSAGNYVRLAADPDAQNDSWLDGLSRKDMRRAKEAQAARAENQRRAAAENDALLTQDLLDSLIRGLETGETPLEALQRLNRINNNSSSSTSNNKSSSTTTTKKLPKWKQAREEKKKQKKQGQAESSSNGEMDIDDPTTTTMIMTTNKEIPSAELTRRQTIETITAAADALYSRGQHEIYQTERELLLRQYQRETGEEWKKPSASLEDNDDDIDENGSQYEYEYEYRWNKNNNSTSHTTEDEDKDRQIYGPYDAATMKAWHAAGYFGQGVEFRRTTKNNNHDDKSNGNSGGGGEWTRALEFT